jgi:transcriptional regulator with PAS, ATPase and Fis domain
MIDPIKAKLWNLLKDKSVSLVMIYNEKGEILWHRGRQITGRNVQEGGNFCKSYIFKSFKKKEEILKRNVGVSSLEDGLSESAEQLMIRSVFIIPLEYDFYLYLDSGHRMYFDDTELAKFQVLASLLSETIQRIKTNETGLNGISGESDQMEEIKKLVLRYSLEEDCVLLLGETGVGKSHIAELIHQYSGRKGKFVVADTTCINENLFESVIFGHKKGAFTGAVDQRRGLVDEAAGGTLFFDEVSEVPVSFQAKLLRFIETKRYRVLGDPQEKLADVRIVAATNRELKQMIENNEFRLDLFYRLNILSIKIPPLRERKEDIKGIIEENRTLLKDKEIGAGFWDAIGDYHWPGNYRELLTVLKRMAILCSSPISGEDVKKIICEDKIFTDDIEKNRADLVWQRLEAGVSFWEAVTDPYIDHELTRSEVKNIISKALKAVGGKYIDTMDLFNIERSEYRKFIKFLHNNKII